MQAVIINALADLPKELITFLMAMIPGFELKAAMSIAVLKFNLSFGWAFLWSTLGSFSMGAVFFGVFNWLLQKILKKFIAAERLWFGTIGRLREIYKRGFRIWEGGLLILFIIIPLPGFGSFFAALLAALVQTDAKKALAYLWLGNILSGIIIMEILIGLK